MNARTIRNNRRSRWLRFVMAPVLGLTLALCGCEDEETTSDITATRFFMERELSSYSSVDNFTWDTTLSQATATIRVKDFTRGDATLRVFDANGRVLLTRAIFTPNNTIYTGGNEYVAVVRTAAGAPGAWRVEMGYDDFWGEISLTME